MKTKILWGTICIITLLFNTAFTPLMSTQMLSDSDAANSLAMIAPLQGEIFWRQASEQAWFSIAAEQVLASGNQVLTKADGRAKIEYFDGIIVRVGPHTLFTVTEQAQTEELSLISRIRLLMGQIFIKHGEGYYDGKFEVETPSGVAAVKGTMMSVQITPDGQTLVTCLEGVCAISNDFGELTLTEGQGAAIQSEEEAPQPAEIEDWQLNDWFENDPETINTALEQGLINQIPITCNTLTGENCLPAAQACNPLTGGERCDLAAACDPISGDGCINENIPLPEDIINCVFNGTCIAEDLWPVDPGSIILPDGSFQNDLGGNLPDTTGDVLSDADDGVLPDAPVDTSLPNITVPDVTVPEIVSPEPPTDLGGFFENLIQGLQNLAELHDQFRHGN